MAYKLINGKFEKVDKAERFPENTPMVGPSSISNPNEDEQMDDTQSDAPRRGRTKQGA